jgi:hypothetical protein
MIPLIQGSVGYAKCGDLELILISRRRWQNGAPKFFSTGIDEEGNSANCVETEQIVIKYVKKESF